MMLSVRSMWALSPATDISDEISYKQFLDEYVETSENAVDHRGELTTATG